MIVQFMRSPNLFADYSSCMNDSSNQITYKELKYLYKQSLINKYNHLEQFKKS